MNCWLCTPASLELASILSSVISTKVIAAGTHVAAVTCQMPTNNGVLAQPCHSCSHWASHHPIPGLYQTYPAHYSRWFMAVDSLYSWPRYSSPPCTKLLIAYEATTRHCPNRPTLIDQTTITGIVPKHILDIYPSLALRQVFITKIGRRLLLLILLVYQYITFYYFDFRGGALDPYYYRKAPYYPFYKVQLPRVGFGAVKILQSIANRSQCQFSPTGKDLIYVI